MRFIQCIALIGVTGSLLACGSSSDHGGGGGGSTGTGGNGTGGSTQPSNGVSVTPADARVGYNGHVQFMALVGGVSDKTVTWSVVEGDSGGSITDAGVYTAPGSSGVFHVKAVSNANASLFGSSKVTVSAPSGTPPTLTPGTWAEITPAQLNLACCPGSGGNSFGVPEFEIDPGDPRTIYICADQFGIWKTTDGGSTWSVLGDPNGAISDTQASYLDSPIAVRVDPKDSTHLYATQGVRGKTLGFWVSHDSGATWTKPQGFIDIGKTATTDVTTIDIDPSDFKHILLGSHSAWANMKNAGILESQDGGDTWTAHMPQASWPAGSMGIHFLYSPDLTTGDSQTWLVGADGNGFWRTTDSGKTWKQVSTKDNIPHGGHQIYYGSGGYVYAGATPYAVRSMDNGETWEEMTQLPFSYYYSVYGDGTNLYTQKSFTGANGGDPAGYYTAPEGDSLSWVAMPGGQKFTDGPFRMGFDSANRILYSANWDAGFLALKVQ